MINRDIWSVTEDGAKSNVSQLRQGNRLGSQVRSVGEGQLCTL